MGKRSQRAGGTAHRPKGCSHGEVRRDAPTGWRSHAAAVCAAGRAAKHGAPAAKPRQGMDGERGRHAPD